MPILQDFVPKPCEKIIADQIMSKDLIILQRVDSIKNIKAACESGHHGFPVVNKAGNLIGIMPRNIIITILKEEGYYHALDKTEGTTEYSFAVGAKPNNLDKFIQNDLKVNPADVRLNQTNGTTSEQTSVAMYSENVSFQNNLDASKKFQSHSVNMSIKNPKFRKMSTRNMDDQKKAVDKYSLTTGAQDEFAMDRKGTYINFTGEFDDEFPNTPEEEILPWQAFCRDFWSKDLVFDGALAIQCEENQDKKIDMRPYMIYNPYTIFTTDRLDKCVEVFRKMHLRHLPVIHPGNGSLKGIITRQDLFQFLDL